MSTALSERPELEVEAGLEPAAEETEWLEDQDHDDGEAEDDGHELAEVREELSVPSRVHRMAESEASIGTAPGKVNAVAGLSGPESPAGAGCGS